MTVATRPLPFDRFRPSLWWMTAGSVTFLGLFADILFDGAGLGINVPLWIGALIGAFVLVARRAATPIGSRSAGLFVASFGAAVMVAWRSAEALQIVLLLASVGLLLLALVAGTDGRMRRVSITSFFARLGLAVVSVMRGVVELPQTAPWRELVDRDVRQRAQYVGRAVLIAVPLILVFGALFAAADAVFESWIRNSLTIDLSSIRGHLRWWFAGAATAAGVVWCGLGGEQPVSAGPRLADERRLRAPETAVVLGSLAALFALFVVIQLQYLFGGQERVLASTGLTYAQYARRGFFELVAVGALLLPVLLAADWARARSGRSITTYRVFAGVLVFLLLIVMTSAFQRLRIYIDVFGLTVLRFYAAALLTWLAAVFGWLLWSLLRERRDEFIAGAVVTALLAIVVVVAINPHGTIAATNLARAENGREFDVPHALGLSVDATPTLIAGIEALPSAEACELASAILERSDSAEDDLRSWTWGRSAAVAAVEANRDQLQSACS